MRASNKARRSQGFTLLEVMMAVAILTMGMTGIVMMQGVSTNTNQNAGETTTAIAFADVWVDRVKRDALAWTAVGSDALQATQYLSIPSGRWEVPKPLDFNESWAADYFGRDVRPGGRVPLYFCANLRNTEQSLATAGVLSTVNAMRVDVRVWWHRSGGDAKRRLGGMDTGCETAPVDLGANPAYRIVYASTLVRWGM